jgi:hypothetical protein
MGFWSRKQEEPPAEDGESTPTTTKGDLNKIAAENDVTASASQAAGTAWLAGHLNHLTPEQEEKLVEFKALVEEKEYYKPSKDGEAASHTDATLLFVPFIYFFFFFKLILLDGSYALASSMFRAPTSNSPRRRTGVRRRR